MVSLAVDRLRTDTLYAGTANSGLFKSVDGGTSWQQVADQETLSSSSVLGVTPKRVRLPGRTIPPNTMRRTAISYRSGRPQPCAAEVRAGGEVRGSGATARGAVTATPYRRPRTDPQDLPGQVRAGAPR